MTRRQQDDDEPQNDSPAADERYVPPAEGVPSMSCPTCGRQAPVVRVGETSMVDGIEFRQVVDLPGYHGTACPNAR